MRMSPTLYVYFARQFLLWLVGILLTLIAIIILFDVVELTRRAQGKEDADFWIVLRMVLLRAPL